VSILAGVAGLVSAGSPSAATAPVAATRPAPRHESAAAAARFQAALKAGDVKGAKALVANSQRPVADLGKRLGRMVEKFKDEQSEFGVYDARGDGDVAVVIVGYSQKGGAKTFEADEWYLVRQSGEWRVLANLHDFERPEYGFDEARVEAYRRLAGWAEERGRGLRKELTGCDC
jgi:hypothetical protein